MTTEDRELELWKQEWQAEDTGALPQLRRRVRLQTVRMIASNFLGLIVSVAYLVYAARHVMRQPTPRTIVWGGAVLLCWLATGIFIVWNQIGIWRVDTESTRAYAELTYKRALTKVRKTRFMLRMFSCCVAFDVAYLVWAGWPPIADLVRVSAGLLAIWLFIRWYGRRKAQQVEQARRFMEELGC